jgi:rRNA maturation RNase YbeY
LIKKILKDQNNSNHSNILIRNFHPSEKPPISKKSICSIIRKVFEKEQLHLRTVELDFVTDKDIKKINRTYLKHNYITDIITFPYSAKEQGVEAECIISLDSVKKNAKIYSSGYKNELKRVIVHGCLHLAGYNDRTEFEKKQIRKKENIYIGD